MERSSGWQHMLGSRGRRCCACHAHHPASTQGRNTANISSLCLTHDAVFCHGGQHVLALAKAVHCRPGGGMCCQSEWRSNPAPHDLPILPPCSWQPRWLLLARIKRAWCSRRAHLRSRPLGRCPQCTGRCGRGRTARHTGTPAAQQGAVMLTLMLRLSNLCQPLRHSLAVAEHWQKLAALLAHCVRLWVVALCRQGVHRLPCRPGERDGRAGEGSRFLHSVAILHVHPLVVERCGERQENDDQLSNLHRSTAAPAKQSSQHCQQPGCPL